MTQKEEFYKNCMVLDTETNSDDYKIAEIIESGFVLKGEKDWEIYQELHKPIDRKIPPKVESICYITNAMVEDKPSFIDSREVFQEVVNGFMAEGYFIAHNHFYDMRVLQNHGIDLGECNWICTWRMAKKLFNGIPDIEETNLPYLRFALELDVPIEMRCHRAGNDSYMTAKLLETFVDFMEARGMIDTSLPYGPQIMEFAAAPIIYEAMPFGKHKGVKMKDVPKNYWTWALNNTDWFNDQADNYDPDLAASIGAILD